MGLGLRAPTYGLRLWAWVFRLWDLGFDAGAAPQARQKVARVEARRSPLPKPKAKTQRFARFWLQVLTQFPRKGYI
jgi:hypothetical protein